MPASAAPRPSAPEERPDQTVSEVIARALIPHVGAFFGLMGNGNSFFVDALERLGPGVIPVRHEVATVASADAYHRVTRRLAVATATYGAGFTTTLTALAEAAQSRTPLVLVVGDAPTSGPRPWDVDQVGAAAALGAPTLVVSADDAGATAVRAVHRALTERTPVVLAIPYDLVAAPVQGDGARIPDLALPAHALPAPEEAAVERFADALRGAERPLILAGRGARGAEADLRVVAGLLSADVATTAPAQGTFTPAAGETAGYRELGICGGFAAAGSAERIRAADVVLVVGAGLNQFTMSFGRSFGAEAQVLQIDLASAATHPRVGEHLRAETVPALAALRSLLEDDDAARGLVDSGAAPDAVVADADPGADPTTRPDGDPLAPDGRLDPRSLMRRIDAALPAERIVSIDGGHFIEWAVTYLPVTAPDRMIMLGTQFQSIGLGFPAAAGVNAGAGEAVSVLVTGDGGGLMGIADAETFIRTARRGVIVVMNDGAYGAEIHQYGSRGLAEAPMRIPEIDFAGILGALGARSRVVRTLEDLADFQRWAEAGCDGVYALDCRISGDVMAPHMREVLAQAKGARTRRP
ncbi:thiamine pyrophosphate-binding protein [Rothia kristinae]|uniref:thiamine pyrophosphate-binding protein n=1 Tax=Rothia kristinae TaxID=37923 RepID=UPI000736D5DD|nr:thiamine pyrophosphate-binding protein [Rothia kristinae]KTR37908.1 thiamine pyrophosphate-binding protein [Rothia kristinae]KTR58379.1 thiamine pyrophosphate-binding protein [Rothia kristinae]KTR67355.1 thiamine pyrophosphate-binding protein [Rothia kristinae]KTR73584.1 thiamine pyrophosphate-binding protein [Rothia kristinae]KTR79676.1 thiamine pyrophosphate-binding protein [Rothia kristinae]